MGTMSINVLLGNHSDLSGIFASAVAPLLNSAIANFYCAIHQCHEESLVVLPSLGSVGF
jgi:hypothetical protein